jgi:hypothetical protein
MVMPGDERENSTERNKTERKKTPQSRNKHDVEFGTCLLSPVPRCDNTLPSSVNDFPLDTVHAQSHGIDGICLANGGHCIWVGD